MKKIIVGKIVNTHGVRGDLKVQRTNNETFKRDVDYFIGDEFEKIEISNAKSSGELSFIRLKDLDNINLVEKYKGEFIYVNENDLYKLNEDEYYVNDLIGLDVLNENHILVGNIKDVLTYAANDIYIVLTEDGEKMVPAVKEFILEVNLEKKYIVIKFIEGM